MYFRNIPLFQRDNEEATITVIHGVCVCVWYKYVEQKEMW